MKLFNRDLIARLHTFCRQLNIASWAPDWPSLVLLGYREHRMAAAKFGVFGNNIETTCVREKGVWGHLSEAPRAGRGAGVPRLHVALTNCFPRLLGGSLGPVVSAEGPWESLVTAMARVAMTYMAYKPLGKQGRSCDGSASGGSSKLKVMNLTQSWGRFPGGKGDLQGGADDSIKKRGVF